MGKKENDESYPKKISAIIEAAFLFVLAQNALLLSKPIISLLNHDSIQLVHVMLITIPLINISAIISNWITSNIYESSYNINMLIEDILTLGVFFLQVHVINEMCSDGKLLELRMLQIFSGITYFTVFFLFLIWNIALFKRAQQQAKKKIVAANIQNIFVMIINISYFILALLKYDLIFFIGYCLFLLMWVYIFLYHNRKNKIADVLIKK